MRGVLSSLIAAAGLFAAACPHAGVVDDSRARELIAKHVDTRAPQTGLAAAIVTPAGVRQYFYGSSGNAQRPAIDESTVFELGSIVKTMTAALLMDMVTRGEVRLDTPLHDLLPPGVRLGHEKPRAIVLEDMVTHFSGLPAVPSGLGFKLAALRNLDNPYKDYSADDLWAWFNERNFKHVGERFEYSNVAFGALGEVLARRAGGTYQEVVKTRIFQPLGMRDIFIAIPPEVAPRVAQPHNEKGKPVPLWDTTAFAGAGAFRSTLTEMVTWARANMTQQPPLVPTLYTPRRELDRPGLKVALSWVVSEYQGTTMIWHNGGTGGSTSFLGFIPKTQEAVVVLTNSAVQPDELAVQLIGLK